MLKIAVVAPTMSKIQKLLDSIATTSDSKSIKRQRDKVITDDAVYIAAPLTYNPTGEYFDQVAYDSKYGWDLTLDMHARHLLARSCVPKDNWFLDYKDINR